MAEHQNHVNLKRKLGFKLHDGVNCKEQTILESIKYTFEGENIQAQYTAIGYRIDLHFCEYKSTIEIDESGYNDGNIDYEIQRQRAI